MNTFTPAQNNFRFYNDDGSESTATPISPEKESVYIDLTTGDKNLHLRILLQETGAADGATTDDWQLQYSKNGAAFTSITTSSSNVKAFGSANLTHAGVTTNRATGITDGTGSFVAAEVSETGLITDRQLTTSNFTEMLYALTIIAADLSEGDVLTFRMLFNGATFTYNFTPRIVILDTKVRTLNNYQSVDVGDGMSTGERVK